MKHPLRKDNDPIFRYLLGDTAHIGIVMHRAGYGHQLSSAALGSLDRPEAGCKSKLPRYAECVNLQASRLC